MSARGGSAIGGKKILLVTRPICPPWDEASKNFAYYLARNIKSLTFTLLTCGKMKGLPENIEQKSIYTSAKLSWWQRLNLLKVIPLKNKFDVVHFMLTPNKLNVFAFRKLLKSKKARTIQTIATLREDLYSDEDLKRLMFADLIITYSDHACNKLKSLGLKNVKRVYPGIDLEEYRRKEKDPDLMREFNFSPLDFIINFTGEYTRLGAMDDVIDAFIEISREIPNAKLSLAVRIKNDADAKKKEEVIQKLKDNDLFGRVAFQDDGSYQMTDVYNLCDVSIFPVQNMKGKFDVPLAVIEAMACEKPVIISDLEILQEFTKDDNSVRIKKGNVKELVDELKNLVNSKENRERIGKEARRYVEENFDIKNVAKNYQEIYEKL